MKYITMLALTAGLLSASPALLANTQALKSALDRNAPPFAMPRLGGSIEGLSVDMTAEIGKRLGREINLEGMAFSLLLPALQAGTFDFLSVPLTISEERARTFLLTEGIWSLQVAFVVRAGAAAVDSIDDLRGATLATNSGNIDDRWARSEADQYGWRIDAYGSLNDAVQAVEAGRADAAVVNNVTALYMAAHNPRIAVTPLRIDNHSYFTYAVPLGSEQLRAQIDTAIECIKLDGTAARLYEKWLGEAPAPGSLDVTPQPGVGPVGYANYDPTPHPRPCDSATLTPTTAAQ